MLSHARRAWPGRVAVVRGVQGALSYREGVGDRYAELMAPEKDRKAARQEFEVAYYTKELGRSLQRKMLQKRLDDFTDSGGIAAAKHGELAAEHFDPPPPEDRAG
jgi:hypothetical protein